MPNSFNDIELYEHISKELELKRVKEEKRRAMEEAHNVMTSKPLIPYPFPVGAGGIQSDLTQKINTNYQPSDIIDRLLGKPHRFEVRTYTENWNGHIKTILHIALLDKNNKGIVRFEEDPDTFPSDRLIDALRLLR